MQLKINGTQVPVMPKTLLITSMDIDNEETTKRTADGTLIRDRITTKRKIELEWGLLKWNEVSAILNLVKDVFFDVYYPDPMTGKYETKTFYCSNRPAGIAIEKGNEIYWSDIKLSLIEK